MSVETPEHDGMFRLAIDTIPGLVWTALPDGVVDFLNQRWLDYTGMSFEEARGMGWIQAIHPDDRAQLRATNKIILAEGKPGEAEARVRRADGVYRWFILRAMPLRDDGGTIVKWYGQKTDIEDRKRTEASLAEAQRLSHTGSFFWRAGTTEFVWSEETFRIYGMDSGSPPSWAEVRERIHPEDRELFDRAASAAAERGDEIRFEHRLLMPDGTVKHLHVVAHGMRADAGQPLEYVGAVMDITERKRAEESLSRMRTELAHVSRVTALGQMTASIAHEINQPLAGILTNGTACLNWLAAATPNVHEATEAARRIVRDGKRAGDVITRLRALFRRSEPRQDRLDLNDVVAEVLALTRSELQRHGVRWRTDPGAIAPVSGDRVELQQLLLNLVLNGAEAMDAVEPATRELVIRTRSSDGGVLLEVEDRGPGIDPAVSERLFDAFVTTKSQGMGMGLAICRSIAENHGGRLEAGAGAGPGALMSLWLPATPEAPAPS